MTWISVLTNTASMNKKLFSWLVFCGAVTAGMLLGRLVLQTDQAKDMTIEHNSQEFYHRTRILSEIRDDILKGKRFRGVANSKTQSKIEQQNLDDLQKSRTKTSYRIPNIVHYVIYSRYIRPFQFTEYVSVLSVLKNHDTEQNWIHSNRDPIGHWCDELMQNISWYHLRVVHMDIPDKIGSTMITSLEQAIDIAKIQILSKYGGIYIDTDIILIQSLDPLRNYPAVYGQESSMKTSPAIVLAEPSSKFLELVYNSYLQDYRPSNPDYNNGILPYKLALNHPDLVYVESANLVAPGLAKTHLLFSDNTELLQWHNFYAIHLRFHGSESKIYNPTYIKPLRNLAGRLLKYIYYGSEDNGDPYLENIMSKNSDKIGSQIHQSSAKSI
jgi:hypothetical protein